VFQPRNFRKMLQEVFQGDVARLGDFELRGWEMKGKAVEWGASFVGCGPSFTIFVPSLSFSNNLRTLAM
jgi:hypothetical protein